VEEDELTTAPPWALTSAFSTRIVGVSRRDGTWSVVADGPAATSRSLDGALVSAVDPAGPLAELAKLSSTARALS
jgi:hypothetical protein